MPGTLETEVSVTTVEVGTYVVPVDVHWVDEEVIVVFP